MNIKIKWTIGILTIFLWIIIVCLYCWWYVTSILAQPGWDAYVYSVGFQISMFLINRFPFLLMALFATLLIEGIIFRFYKKED